MSYNGSGVFNINTAGQPVVTGTVISSTAFNALTADLATGLTTALTKDGQTTPTANIPMGGFKITGIAAATTTGDALSYGRAATVTSISASSVTDSGLTSGRVTYAGTGGLLQDSANFVFDGTNLGIGITPTNSANYTTLEVSNATNGAIFNLCNGATNKGQVFYDSGGIGVNTLGTARNIRWKAGAISGATDGHMTLNTSGNLGIGVVPSAWSSGKVVEIGNYGNAFFNNGAAENHLTTNAYYNSGWKFGGTGYAQKLTTDSGQYQFNVSTASGTAGNAVTFTQAMTLDASGNLGVGTASPASISGKTIDISSSTNVALYLHGSSTSGATGGFSIQQDSSQNTFVWNYSNSYMAFATNNTERMRINSSGNLGIGVTSPACILDISGSTGGQIKFPATQNASSDANTLDDYEEGTWTPSLTGTATYTTQSGKYTKIGNFVWAEFRLKINVIGTSSSEFFVQGLPFTGTGSPINSSGGVSYWSSLAVSPYYLSLQVSNTSANVMIVGTTGAQANITNGIAIFGSGSELIAAFGYYTAT